MLKLDKIAITGGTASGKSTVCQFFKDLGAYVVDADRLTHELLDPAKDLGQQILRTFGPEILENGQINRRILAEKAFSDESSLEKLEGILHPAVFEKIDRLYTEACKGEFSSFVAEIPLLFEAKREDCFDIIIAVLSTPAVARKRFEQAGFQPMEYDLRMRRQLSQEQKAAKAHYTIYNNGSLEDLKQQVFEVNRKIINGVS